MTKKSFLTVVSTVLLVFMLVGCGNGNKEESETPDSSDTGTVTDTDPTDTGDTDVVPDADPTDTSTGGGFEAVDVGECRHEEPAFSFRDRIYTEPKDEFSCKEYLEVTKKKENTIKFNWFGEMRCGIDWEYGYKVAGVSGDILKVNILERDTDLEIAADCDSCCYLMPIEYTAETAEEIESVKAIEINYEGKNHKVVFRIDEETANPETPDDELPHQCEDSEGRIYNEGDIISDECLRAYCMDDGGWAEDATTCYGCWGKEIGDKMKWTCDDGVTEVDWCECVEEENYGSEWKCADRVDLNCPKE